MSKYIKVRGKIYRAVDDSASALMACDNAARRVAKLATLTRDKERKSIEDAFVFFEERVDSMYNELGKLLEQARRELAREALKYQKSVGIRYK